MGASCSAAIDTTTYEVFNPITVGDGPVRIAIAFVPNGCPLPTSTPIPTHARAHADADQHVDGHSHVHAHADIHGDDHSYAVYHSHETPDADANAHGEL